MHLEGAKNTQGRKSTKKSSKKQQNQQETQLK